MNASKKYPLAGFADEMSHAELVQIADGLLGELLAVRIEQESARKRELLYAKGIAKAYEQRDVLAAKLEAKEPTADIIAKAKKWDDYQAGRAVCRSIWQRVLMAVGLAGIAVAAIWGASH